MPSTMLREEDRPTDTGALPDEKLLTQVRKYNEELVKAGVLLWTEGELTRPQSSLLGIEPT